MDGEIIADARLRVYLGSCNFFLLKPFETRADKIKPERWHYPVLHS